MHVFIELYSCLKVFVPVFHKKKEEETNSEKRKYIKLSSVRL